MSIVETPLSNKNVDLPISYNKIAKSFFSYPKHTQNKKKGYICRSTTNHSQLPFFIHNPMNHFFKLSFLCLLCLFFAAPLMAQGTSCSNATVVTVGSYTAPGPDAWYSFTPDTTGLFVLGTCTGNTCNTAVWFYDHCTGIVYDDLQTGSVAWSSSGCGNQATLQTGLFKNVTYYIRIGDEGTSCQSTAIQWDLSFAGAITGCMDLDACNYNPTATINDPAMCLSAGNPNCPSGPDLMVVESELSSSMYFQTLNSTNACTVAEGCMKGYGTREIVRFTTHIKNIGNQDYYVGQTPASTATATTQWEWDECHGHWHYEGYAEYLLYDANGVKIPAGFKNGFCVMDLECGDGGSAKFNCTNQGITAQCGDIYNSGLQCQWIDITNIPAGLYTMVVRVNWDHSPDKLGNYETRYDNNWGQMCININRSGGTTTVTLAETCNPFIDCTGEIYGSAQPDCDGNCNGIRKAGDLNVNYQRDNNDRGLYANGILQNTLTPASCNDLNLDNNISVTDLAYLNACLMQEAGITDDHGHDHCDLPAFNIYNPNDTAWFAIGNYSAANQYIDIYLRSPITHLHALQFDVSGINITNAVLQPIADYNANVYYNATTGRVIIYPSDTTHIEHIDDFAPFLRLYYSNASISISDVLLNNFTLVNDHLEEFVAQYYYTPTLPPSCSLAMQVCLNGAFSYPANTSSNNTGAIGCINNTSNRGWTYLPVSSSGNISISANNTAGANINYAVWGPFANVAAALGSCGSLGTPIHCESGPAPNTNFTLTGATAGQVYLLLTTNQSAAITNIVLQQTGGTGSVGVTAQAATLTACNTGNNTGSFVLSNAAVVPASLTGATVSYYPTLADANNKTNAIAQTPYVSAATTVYARVESSTGCYAISTITLALAAAPSGTISGGTCSANVSLNLAVSSGTAPYTFAWNDGVTTQNRTNVDAGTYTVTITDANGCNATATKTVAVCCFTAVRACLNAPFTYPVSTTGTAETGNNYGCLSQRPKPRWFWLPASKLGTVTLNINASPAIDIDYAVWGPFSSEAAVSCGTLPAPISCDYTGTIGGTANLTVTAAGQGFLVLVTNFTSSTANIILQQTGGTGALGVTANNATLQACDLGNSTANFNLSSATVVPSSLVGVSARFFANQNDAQNGTNALNATSYNSPAATVYARVELPNSCFAISTVTLQLKAKPSANLSNANICAGQTATLTPTGGTYTAYLWSNGSTTSGINAASSGTYTVTVTAANACTATAAATITQSTPTTTIGNVNNAACGALGSMSATSTGGTAPYSLAWSNGQISSTINNLSVATYTVTVSDATNCTATASASITSNLNPPATLNVVNITNTSAKLQWSSVAGATNYTIQGRKVGTATWTTIGPLTGNSKTVNTLSACKNYEWKVRANCTGGTSSAFSTLNTFVTAGCAGMLYADEQDAAKTDNEFTAEALTLTPNPANNAVTINYYTDTENPITIRLFDTLGKTVLQQQANATLGENQLNIDLTALPQGYYLVELNDGVTRVNQKLVVVK